MTKSLSWVLVLVLIFSAVVNPVRIALTPMNEPNSSEPWAMFRHDANHTGFSTSTAPNDNKTTGGLLWTSGTGREIESSPAVANGRVFIGSNDGYIYAFNETTGDELWKTKVGNLISSSPAVAHGKVFAAAGNGTVCALDETNGAVIWSNTTFGGVNEGVYYSSPAVADNKVFVGSHNRTVYAFDCATGHRLWNRTIGGNVKSSPAVAYGKVFVGCLDLYIYALDETTGEQLWNYSTRGMIASSPTVAYEKVFIGSNSKRVYCLNASTGEHLWNYTTENSVRSSPAIAHGFVFVGSDDKKVYCLNETTGAYVWSYTTEGAVRSSPAVADGKVIVGSSDWNIYTLNETTGSLMWSYRTSGAVESSPAVADGIVFVGSCDKNVYAFGPNTAPINCFEYEPEKPIEKQDVTFDASCTYDPEGDSINYTWDFGDRTSTKTGKTVTQAYATAGAYNVTLTTTDEHGAKNTTWQPITVLKHDVAVVDVTPSKFGVIQGDTLNINVTVENQGDFDEFNVTVTAYANETEIGEKTILFLVKGINETVTIPWNTTGFSKGSYTIRAEASVVPDETETADNSRFDGYVGVTVHDVAVISVIASKNVASQGEIVDINVTVENQGSYSETFNLTTYYNGNLINTTRDVFLNIGTSETLSLPWNTSTVVPGSYNICANASVVENETDIADNINCTTIVKIMLPVHDVAIVPPVIASPLEAFISDQVEIIVWVKNQGNFTESVTLITYANTNKTDSTKVIVGPGQTSSVALFWNTTNFPSGEYLITANATIPIDDDPSDNICSDGTVTLKTREHDVAVTHIVPSPNIVIWRASVNVNVTVANLGNFTEFNLNVIAYADKNDTVVGDEIIIGIDSVSVLDAGKSQILQFDWDTGSVSFSDLPCTFYICANVSAVPEEKILDNNHFWKVDVTVTVKAPIVDVAVTHVVPSKREPFQGETMNIVVTVKNEGIDAWTINVTAYAVNAGNFTIGSQIISFLASLTTKTVTILWNTTSAPFGKYTISANASVSGDEYPLNDALTDGIVTVKEPIRHDVAVTVVQFDYQPPSRLPVSPTHPKRIRLVTNVSVTIENPGHFPEMVNVTVYLRLNHAWQNETDPIGNQTIIMAPIESRTVTIQCCVWNNSKVEKDIKSFPPTLTFWIVARANIPIDDYPDNNVKDSKPFIIRVSLPTDITGPDGWADWKVNIRDISMVAGGYGAIHITDPTSPKFCQYWHSPPCPYCPHSPYCDLTGPTPGVPDGKVNIRDISMVAGDFGKNYDP